MSAPNLAQRPPRSPRVRLGGFVLLPRVLDKCRAALAGAAGEYKFNCPVDRQFFDHFGIDADAFQRQAQTGQGDAEMLAWVRANARRGVTAIDILQWSAYQEQRAPASLESREFFSQLQKNCAPLREDITTWFDLLDLDDHVTFGGKP